MIGTYREQRQARFVQFVQDLVFASAGNGTATSTWWKNLHYMHVFSMSRVLVELHRVNLTLTAYLPSLEDLDTGFPALVQQHCAFVETGPSLTNGVQPGVGPSEHESSRDPEGLFTVHERANLVLGILERITIDQEINVHQMTFMLCETLHALNEAASHYKRQNCKEEPNLKKIKKFE